MRTRFVLGAVFTMATLKAGVIYDNGGPDTVPPQTGLPIRIFSVADDFKLGSSATILSVNFFVQTDNGIATWNQDVNYTFLSDSSGSPGSVLATGTAQNLVETDTGLPWCCSKENVYSAKFNLQSGFAATGGTTYWLQLSGATTTSGFAYWVTTGGSAGTPTAFWEGAHNGAYQLAFNLSDTLVSSASTPEPAAMTLSGAGLIAFALAAWRRKRSSIGRSVGRASF